MNVLIILLALAGVSVVFGFTPIGSTGSKIVSTSTIELFAAQEKTKEKPPTFNKSDFISKLSDKTGLKKKDSEGALAAVVDIIQEEVAAGKRINILGFGTFKLNYRAARKGRNPRTGEEIDIRESYSPSFSASQTFKDACNPN